MITIILCFFAAILGIILPILGRRKPFVIKFSYSPFDWAEPIMMIFCFFAAFFVLEFAVSNYVVSKCYESSPALTLCSKFFENGLLIPFISVLLSIIFEKMIEELNLDYLEYYNDLIAKICFSFLVFAWCFALIVVVWSKMDSMSIEEEAILNRILMWMLTIIGTWLGFGFKCIGRTEKEKTRKRTLLKEIDHKKVFKFWLPILISIVISIGILFWVIFFSNQAVKFEMTLFCIALSFVIPGVVIMLVWGRKNNPTKKQSENDFYKVLKKLKRNEVVEKHFGRNRYHIEGNILILERVDIRYPDHELDEDFLSLFSRIEFPFDFEHYEDSLELLKSRYDSQEEYIRKGFEKCTEEMKKRKMQMGS